MNRDTHYSIVTNRIETLLDSLGPQSQRTRAALEQIAGLAFEQGRQYALTSLLTSNDLAEMFHVSIRRIRAIAQDRHERFGIGYRTPKGEWLFTPEEVEQLRPNPKFQRTAR